MIKSIQSTIIRLFAKNGDGTPCTGAVTYETEYAFFTEDLAYILDIGKIIIARGTTDPCLKLELRGGH